MRECCAPFPTGLSFPFPIPLPKASSLLPQRALRLLTKMVFLGIYLSPWLDLSPWRQDSTLITLPALIQEAQPKDS